MKHLTPFALYEIRKVRNYREPEDSPYAYAHQHDKAAEAKLRLQVAPLYDWCHRALEKLVAKWNAEHPEHRPIHTKKLDDWFPFNPSFSFNSDKQYEEDGFAFSVPVGCATFDIKRVEGKLTVVHTRPEQLVFAPTELEQEMHRLLRRNLHRFNELLDNEGDYLDQEPEMHIDTE